jgi:hypothetical protein
MINKLLPKLVTEILVFALPICLFFVCQAEGVKRVDDLKVTKICEIRKNPELYEGKIVRVQGIYKSDNSFYSFIEDESCSSMKTINVIDAFHTSGDSSIVDFFRRDREVCKISGPSVCLTNIKVDAVAKICKQPNGKVLLDFKTILNFHRLRSSGSGEVSEVSIPGRALGEFDFEVQHPER